MTPEADPGSDTTSTTTARSRAIRLVLAETYPVLLAGMERIFTLEPGFLVTACCTTGDEASRAVRSHRPDVLVLDLDIPGNAMVILEELAAEQTTTRVVLLAAQLGEHKMLEATRLGVKGILLKNMPRHLLIRCVRKVHRGETWIERACMGRAVEQLLRNEVGYREVATKLSSRELEVVRVSASGRSNKEIADKLSIAEGTVKMHLHHIYEKLGVKGRLELMLYAQDKGLFSPSIQERGPKPR